MADGGFFADVEFERLAASGLQVISPTNPAARQPASVDLSLGGIRYVYLRSSYRLGDPLPDDDFRKEAFAELTLSPHETVFVGLEEKMTIPRDAVGFVFARSSLTRLGLRITPVFMNPGYSGKMPLTITNAAGFPITLVKGVRVAQLVCARLGSIPNRIYEGAEAKYAGEDVSPSRLHTDHDIKAALERALQRYFPEEVVRSVVG